MMLLGNSANDPLIHCEVADQVTLTREGDPSAASPEFLLFPMDQWIESGFS